ncbi:unnamed protein product, partial [Strongylus vulgaris]
THFELLQKGGLYSKLAKAQEVGIDVNEKGPAAKVVTVEPTRVDSLTRHELRTSALSRRSHTSLAAQQIEATKEILNNEKSRGGGILRVYVSSVKRPVFWICLVTGILRGFEMPLASFFTGFTYRALDQTKETYVPIMWVAVAVLIALGFYSWIFMGSSIAFGGWTGEVVTTDMCVAVMRSLLSQDADFFDKPDRSNAACVAELASKAQDIQACLDYRFMLMLNNLVALVACVALTFVACWPSGIANFIMIILVIIGLWVAASIVSKNIARKSEMDKTTELSIEVFEHAQTIQLLTAEDYFVKKFENAQNAVKKQEKRTAIYKAVQFALTQSYIYFSAVTTYGFGALMIYLGHIEAVDAVVAATSATMAGWAVIMASEAFGDFARSHVAAQALYALGDCFKKDERGEEPVRYSTN